MPELPEVETVANSLRRHVLGRRIEAIEVREARLRQAVDGARLRDHLLGRSFIAIERRAKYLIFTTDAETAMLVHLGMSGRLGVVRASQPLQKHDHILWRLAGDYELRFNDPRRFGFVDSCSLGALPEHPRLRDLGVEPLGEAFNGAALYTMTRKSKKPIKNFLMDGRRIVGVGNIYACESLWQARIHPNTAAGTLSPERCERLGEAVRTILKAAIEQGGTTLRDFADADGRAGYFAISLHAYGRDGEACTRCGAAIKRVVHAGRGTFYCPGCQR